MPSKNPMLHSEPSAYHIWHDCRDLKPTMSDTELRTYVLSPALVEMTYNFRPVTVHFRFTNSTATPGWVPPRPAGGDEGMPWEHLHTVLQEIPPTSLNQNLVLLESSLDNYQLNLLLCGLFKPASPRCPECEQPLKRCGGLGVARKHHVQCLWCALHELLESNRDTGAACTKAAEMVLFVSSQC